MFNINAMNARMSLSLIMISIHALNLTEITGSNIWENAMAPIFPKFKSISLTLPLKLK